MMGYREPPDGWYVFGTHIDQDVRLEFSDEKDEAGTPYFERPVKRTKEEIVETQDELADKFEDALPAEPEVMIPLEVLIHDTLIERTTDYIWVEEVTAALMAALSEDTGVCLLCGRTHDPDGSES